VKEKRKSGGERHAYFRTEKRKERTVHVSLGERWNIKFVEGEGKRDVVEFT